MLRADHLEELLIGLTLKMEQLETGGRPTFARQVQPSRWWGALPSFLCAHLTSAVATPVSPV